MAKKNKPRAKLAKTPPAAGVFAGVARRDITPPVGIYSRLWGAAKHDVSEGTHLPLCATALAIRQGRKGEPLILIAIDLVLLGDKADRERVKTRIVEALGLDSSRIMISCSHSHSVVFAATSRTHMPGGQLIPAYFEMVTAAIIESAKEALQTAVPATMTWANGKCDLATNRDLPDLDKSKNRVVCGYNPDIPADDTMVVGRVTRDKDNAVLATLVNYACHPTTLAWDNHLISPDFIGTMRQMVEKHTAGAPCLFLQGASGELAPAHQYVGDVRVAEKHGRQLGYAALSALESMLEPRHELVYQGVVESGAPLAVWLPEPFDPPSQVDAANFTVQMPLKPLPTQAQLEELIAACTDRALKERHYRKLQIVKATGNGATTSMVAWVWRIGQALFIGHPNEAYSSFQTDLRKLFPDHAVVVMNLVEAFNLGYVCPESLFGQQVYQVWQTPFSEKALEELTQSCAKEARKLIGKSKKK